MTKLFIDTTKYITIGLLDKDYNWLSYNLFKDLKASAAIHYKVQIELKKFDIEINELDEVIFMSGPGSYTGMRVSAGIAQVLNFSGIKTYSAYHYDIPRIMGEQRGVWLGDAFKNEYFAFSWNEEKSKAQLIKKDEYIFNQKEYSSFNEKYPKLSTDILIKENPSIIIKKIVDTKINKELYYYRSLEDEFGAKP